MAEIYVAIRNQDRIAMSSVSGELILVLVTSDGRFMAQQPASLRNAMATFFDLPAGKYSVIARHPSLQPTESRKDLELSINAIIGVRFIYNEPERQLLNIETEVSYLP
ncbi:MAG: hypothetical protein HC866_11395 [Leptolyngbyaceae cyanobacterium RU_5_1]|nr:hypothetical protein [Leptolyngbyaceae cyanobacterium RU_5_1]